MATSRVISSISMTVCWFFRIAAELAQAARDDWLKDYGKATNEVDEEEEGDNSQDIAAAASPPSNPPAE